MRLKKKELEEFKEFLKRNQIEAEKASERFEQHSKKFDETIKRIFAML